MTSPLHGEDPEFESQRAHRFFFQSEAEVKAEAQDLENRELHNFQGKLHNLCFADSIESLEREMTDRYVDEEGNEQIEMLLQELVPEEANEIDWNDPNDPYQLKAEAKLREAIRRHREEEAEEKAKKAQVKQSLSFTKEELDQYATFRAEGIRKKSQHWFFKSAEVLWGCTYGEISQDTLTALRNHVIEKYNSPDSHSKILNFAKSFVDHLATTKGEPRYHTYVPHLKPPKIVKERKRVTDRIVTKEDIKNVLEYIKRAERKRDINAERSAQYSAIVLFGAYTGQRSEATIARLTVGQFREAMVADKPVLQVDSSQDKNRMSHYVPLHPSVVETLKPLLVARNDDKPMFTHSSFLNWIKREKISMLRFKGHFVFGDLRKFAEQYGDIIQWNESNRAYILTHGISGIEWAHYRNPLPENVYDIYIKYWWNTDLTS